MQMSTGKIDRIYLKDVIKKMRRHFNSVSLNSIFLYFIMMIVMALM